MSDPIINECNRLLDKVVEVQNEINDLMELRLALREICGKIEKYLDGQIDTREKECRKDHENAESLALEILMRRRGF